MAYDDLPSFSGEPRVLSEGLNAIVDVIRKLRAAVPNITSGPGIRIRKSAGHIVVEATRGNGSYAPGGFPFEVTLNYDAKSDSYSATVAPGAANGVESVETSIADITILDVIYAEALFATAYGDVLPTSVLIKRAASMSEVPESHDTRWIIPIAEIRDPNETGDLEPFQFIESGLESLRCRSPRSFEVTREGDALRIAAGNLIALTNPADAWSLDSLVDSQVLPLQPGVIVLSVDVSAGVQDGEAPYSLGAPTIAFDALTNTNQGLFVPLPLVTVSTVTGTTTDPSTPTEPTSYATGVLDHSMPNPSTRFRFPIATIAAGGGDSFVIRQRQHGDIALPLAINWGIPFKP